MGEHFKLLVLIAAVAGFAALAGCSGASTEEPAEKAAAPVVQVAVQRVEKRQADGALRASGLVAFKSETTLAFPASGVVETLNVDSGARVRAGQVLATLRRTTVGADVAEAEIAKQTAQQTFDRLTRLHAAGAASQADLDNARLALERVRDNISLVAPASGTILRREVERSQVVTQGQPVFTLGEASTGVIVRAQLSSVEVGRVKVGDAAQISIAGRETRAGKVSLIVPKMADGMGSFEVEVRFDDPAGLRSGEVAEVEIAAAGAASSAAPGFLIPAISLIDARADQGMVYVVGEDGKAKRRAVQLEGLVDGGVVVTGGLNEGDAVITRGASMVRDGDPVKVSAD